MAACRNFALTGVGAQSESISTINDGTNERKRRVVNMHEITDLTVMTDSNLAVARDPRSLHEGGDRIGIHAVA